MSNLSYSSKRNSDEDLQNQKDWESLLQRTNMSNLNLYIKIFVERFFTVRISAGKTSNFYPFTSKKYFRRRIDLDTSNLKIRYFQGIEVTSIRGMWVIEVTSNLKIRGMPKMKFQYFT